MGGNLTLLSAVEAMKENVMKVLVNKVPDGSPKMFFVCHHRTPGGPGMFHVRDNEANWEGLPEIAAIRCADRDYRLEAYIPLTSRAFWALYEMERNIELPTTLLNAKDAVKAYETCKLAVASMRSPHADFLGRTTEYGQAFDSTGKSCQCCYVCQGMMGYTVLAQFKSKSVKDYLCHFKWDLRKDYTHSCAEIAVSLQCARNWLQNGRSEKS